ncbi:hypothetical protein SAMN04488038_1259 [Solimonas aquatica]|uniref:Uncharacterized protein n=1 Tax=Solimonas aquatica TaxID=489703 RepID=A0A1H9MK12_9GAMM|nr:hypothetical protein [Solimonas aquatica]SER24032.1 hypothetical protein SAMN04488038_1259 [Solimonas aquatica]
MKGRHSPDIKLLPMLGVVLVLTCASQVWAITPGDQLPRSAHVFELGENMSINGQAIRAAGFVSPQGPEELGVWLRHQSPGGYSESRIGERYILSKVSGTLLTTIEIEPTPEGSAGLIALSDLRQQSDKTSELSRGEVRVLNRLTSDSRLLSLTSSQDRVVVSHQLVITNGKTMAANRQQLIEVMGAIEMKLERETGRDGSTAALGGSVLQFVGAGGEATAVIDARMRGLTSIVLNIERIKRRGM